MALRRTHKLLECVRTIDHPKSVTALGPDANSELSMPLCQAVGVIQSSFTIRTLEPKLSYSETRYSSIRLAVNASQRLPSPLLSLPCQPQRRRGKSKGTQSRHTKHLNRTSSTPPILDRFSPYRHRSRVHSDSPSRCQKVVRTSPSRHDTYMPEVAASNSPTTSQGTWALSPTVSSSARSPPWSQAVTNSIGAVDLTSSSFSSGQPSVQVASRLPPDGQTRSYHLDVVQHPMRTAEFGSASLSRLPLAPPIVVQLVIRDPAGHAINPDMELPFLIAHLSLFTGDGLTPLDMGSAPGGQTPPRRLLYGNLVSSPQKLRDLQGRQGLFFLFPDVSIRWCGQFQLGITLLKLSG